MSSPQSKSPSRTPIDPDPDLDLEDDEDDEGFAIPGDNNEEDKLCIRLVTWNLEGAEDAPHLKDLVSVSFVSENKSVHAFALQEVKCLEKLREGLWVAIGGSSKFELFEHWMGKPGPGSPGQTVLLVFAPKDLCATGRFRLSRYANSQVKREVQRGTRSKLLGGTTASRGAVAMPFAFLDTTFTLVSVKLVEDETEKAVDQQQKDLEKVLELCRMSENAGMGTLGFMHHAFICGSFAMGQNSGKQNNTLNTTQSSSSADDSVGSGSSVRRSISSRFSFTRKATTTATQKSNGTSAQAQSGMFTQTKQKFPMLDEFQELDGMGMAFEPDHVFYKVAAPQLEKCLEPVSTQLLTSVKCGRPPVATMFKLRGRGTELLTSWARLTGNLPIHFSSRANYVHAKNDVAQRPRISTAPQLRKERASRVGTSEFTRSTSDIPHKMSIVEEKFVLQCTKCEAPISDSENIVPVTKDGNAYHARCFCCDHCGVALCGSTTTLAPGQDIQGEIAFHEVEGQLLCQKSFEALYLKCCEGCKGPLGDEFLVLPGHGGEEKRFHVSCFKCGECARPFATKMMLGDIVIEAAIPHEGMYLCEMDFNRIVGGVKCCVCEHSFDKGIKVNGDIYCLQDFQETFSGGSCAICKKPVTDEQALTLSSSDSKQQRKACHMACLKCAMCDKKLHEMNQGFVEFEGQTFCQEDWAKRQASQVTVPCAKCLSPIREKEFVEAMEKRFHSKCFTCAFCDVALAGSKFYMSDARPWCLRDFERFCSPDLPACASCHRTVGSADMPKSKKLDGKTWHVECFICGNCGVSMTGRKPKIVKGKVFCEAC